MFQGRFFGKARNIFGCANQYLSAADEAAEHHPVLREPKSNDLGPAPPFQRAGLQRHHRPHNRPPEHALQQLRQRRAGRRGAGKPLAPDSGLR